MSSNAGASPKLGVAFSTDGEPGRRRSHWTRKTQRKAGWSSCVHPRADSGERPLAGAACGQFKNGADIVGLISFGCNIPHSLTETLEDGDVVHLSMFQRRPVESACPSPKARDFPAICGLDSKAADHIKAEVETHKGANASANVGRMNSTNRQRCRWRTPVYCVVQREDLILLFYRNLNLTCLSIHPQRPKKKRDRSCDTREKLSFSALGMLDRFFFRYDNFVIWFTDKTKKSRQTKHSNIQP